MERCGMTASVSVKVPGWPAGKVGDHLVIVPER
jgi:hypothetical protein